MQGSVNPNSNMAGRNRHVTERAYLAEIWQYGHLPGQDNMYDVSIQPYPYSQHQALPSLRWRPTTWRTKGKLMMGRSSAGLPDVLAVAAPDALSLAVAPSPLLVDTRSAYEGKKE